MKKITLSLLTAASCFVYANEYKALVFQFHHNDVLKEDPKYTMEGNSGTTPPPVEAGLNVKQLITRTGTTLMLRNDGTVWGTGISADGQLGFGNTTNLGSFTKTTLSDIDKISIGNKKTFALDKQGVLWAAGSNGNCEIDSTCSNILSWKKVVVNSDPTLKVTDIVGGEYAEFIVKTNDGKTWRKNTGNTIHAWQEDTFLKDYKQLSYNKSGASGTMLAMVITSDNKTYVRYGNFYGELGLGNKSAVSNWTELATPNVTGAKTLHAGEGRSYIIKSDGTVVAAGRGFAGVLGNGSTSDQTFHVPSLKTDNTPLNNIVSIQGNYSAVMAIDSSGVVWGAGAVNGNMFGQPGSAEYHKFQVIPIPDNEKVKSVTAYYSETLLLTENGRVFTSGPNFNGTLGIGSIPPTSGDTFIEITEDMLVE